MKTETNQDWELTLTQHRVESIPAAQMRCIAVRLDSCNAGRSAYESRRTMLAADRTSNAKSRQRPSDVGMFLSAAYFWQRK